MDKKLSIPETKVQPDMFQPDKPLYEQIQHLLNKIAFKTPLVTETGLEEMDDYFARATDFLAQFKLLEIEVQVLRDAVEAAT
jgi:hypothetical protein